MESWNFRNHASRKSEIHSSRAIGASGRCSPWTIALLPHTQGAAQGSQQKSRLLATLEHTLVNEHDSSRSNGTARRSTVVQSASSYGELSTLLFSLSMPSLDGETAQAEPAPLIAKSIGMEATEPPAVSVQAAPVAAPAPAAKEAPAPALEASDAVAKETVPVQAEGALEVRKRKRENEDDVSCFAQTRKDGRGAASCDIHATDRV